MGDTEETQARRGGQAKRKRETPASRAANNSRNSTPNAFSRRSPPRDPAPIRDPDPEDDGDRSPPRKLKRPGAGARVSQANREVMERERKAREEAARKGLEGRQKAGAELIAEHYNAVPERGRDWRQAESKIAGLRSLNNWIKSTLIQKFSRPDIPVEDLKVLDMACGKGGDLGKWEKAPQVPVLYVGCDIAGVSVEQAQQRYNENLRKSRGRNRRMHAEFYVHDTFGRTLADIPTIRNVGFNPNAGPGPGMIQGGMMSGGFDVISMMFALHYSFESEELARGMLSNVAGSLKKGGRFIGVMPNSDVISANVKNLLSKETPNGATTNGEAPQDSASDDDDWDPEKPTEPVATADNDDDDDDWDPEKPADPEPAPKPTTTSNSNPDLPDLTWGNEIYSVRFPRKQPNDKALPHDGIFRPPFGWRYHYHLEEAVEAPEYVVPWEAFRALADEYGLEMMYRKGFREVFEDETQDPELGMLAERMRVLSRDRTAGEKRDGLLVKEREMEAAGFYHAFCFYKT
ncbi:mRNA cap guanine-N7 methyltransferase [Fulvia fulva]|uniref:mRNA cap guanine-N(7) methyltransferase n=1 Tax=Passalora fulva TaxID=5499 RepID=A0A9Q8L8I7_PASFU|nr:mRNA cap guanine-N7 methyltransferase [Fulvia fulva]KAK4634202.1 mRNA cap guanine-N7 methyltransferase [Fulvia fulva]UJO12860.1 mRNA cap guanine-N7 methyltransferase [Fulvia fulva]WPV09751.1 mRNA cap guanine-N7 methyltransferase [Fulvia fulva]WPV24714.1 mRNA cap guanine-N7 methyltransferase [Fulvia fulva]